MVCPANATPLSGTKAIGPTGDYASLTAAIADVQAQTLGGALMLELQPAYVSTVETFPLTIPSLNGASATNTLTIRPASGATNLLITSADTTAATVDLNGAQFVTIDGRPGGIGSNAGSGGGTASQLTIANTNTGGIALRFINEASGNTIRYATLRSVNTIGTSGTVVFSTTTGANGNDNNTLDHCDLGDGASTPAVGVASFGSTGTTAQNNSGNTVSNCNIFNFYSSSNEATGVRLRGGSTDWTLTGNSFYQTATRSAVPVNCHAIYVFNTSGNNFTVTGNFIGGSAPNVGGSAWTTTGNNQTYSFQGIRLNVGTNTPSSVQGNTIANMVWTTASSISSAGGMWCGIYVVSGSVNVGTVTGNTIGSGTGTGSISVSTLISGGTGFGIASASSGTVTICNNTIGSITVFGADPNGNPSNSVSASLTGIAVTNGTNAISNNTVGSITTANSLDAPSASSSVTGQQVTGIIVSFNSTSASITGNTVANLRNIYIGNASSGMIRGIVTATGVNTITGNTVRNLSTTSQNTNTAVAATIGQSVMGIASISTGPGQTVSQNTVHSLANGLAVKAVSVTGIYFAGPTSGANLITRNLVHSLAIPPFLSSDSTLPQLKGMEFAAGTFAAQDNMISVGQDATRTPTAGGSTVRGIYDNGTETGRNFYHNSVYLGGAQSIGGSSTVAFLSNGATNARTFQNNIFVNVRGNYGGAGKHYAVIYGGTTSSPAVLTAGGNIFYAPNTARGGMLGSYEGIDRTTLADWQAATGQDATSLNTDPLFLNPTGDAATVDLHIPTNSPANNAGVAIGVTDDFDGDVRSVATPTIGADELFLPNIAVEQAAPLIDGVSSVDFGTKVVGAANFSLPIFKITNTGTADLTGIAVTVDGANAGDFAVVILSPFTTIAPGDSRTFNVLFLPGASGARSATLHIASNVAGAKNPFDIALTGTGITVLQDWRRTFYGTTANTGTAANHADPYFTGVPNLAVFAMLGPTQDPAKVALGLLPQPQLVRENYVISFATPAGVSGVTYGAEWSATLQNDWQTIPDTGTAPQHTFSVPIGSDVQLYLRLRVTEQ